jgi:hypothetical protein
MSKEPKKRRRKSPWQKIMRAAKRQTGLYLDAAEALQLSRDDAIATVALDDDDRDAGQEPRGRGF